MPLFTAHQSSRRRRGIVYARTSEVLGRQEDVPNVMLLDQIANLDIDLSSVEAAHEDLAQLPTYHSVR